jgi:hypothetical protein
MLETKAIYSIINNSYTTGHLNVIKPPWCTLLMEGFPTISSLVVAITYPNDELHSKIILELAHGQRKGFGTIQCYIVSI